MRIQSNMLRKISFLALFVKSSLAFSSAFSFHLISDPLTTDPLSANDVTQRYLFTNLYRPLYSYDSTSQLVPDQASDCRWLDSLRLRCEINVDAKWSDGRRLAAEDFLRTYKRVFSANPARAEALLSIKNAKEILAGKKGLDSLGIKAISTTSLVFTLAHPDSEFLGKIATPEFGPTPAEGFPDLTSAATLLVNGPYSIKSWVGGKKITLVPNKNFKSPRKVEVEVYFVPDHLTAYNLFKTNKLSFLRQLPTDLIPKYEKSKSFFQTFISRFDYVGITDSVPLEIRKSIAQSLDYNELQVLYRAKGAPGCPGFADTADARYLDFCLKMQPSAVTKQFSQRGLYIAFDQSGGADFLIGAVWLQNQIKKKLGLAVEVRPQERGIFLQDIKSMKSPIFRKSLAIDRPTCLAALENFTTGNPNNSVKFTVKAFDQLIAKMTNSASENTFANCKRAYDLLMAEFKVLPLGPMHYSMLRSDAFTGWTVNGLNELDLSKLDTRP